jgi:hypothetical protein
LEANEAKRRRFFIAKEHVVSLKKSLLSSQKLPTCQREQRMKPARLQQLPIFTQHTIRDEKKNHHDHSPDGTEKKK